MKQISYAELEAHFDPELRNRLRFLADIPGATAMVLFRNQMIDSSNAGACTARLVGPECSCTSLEQGIRQPPWRPAVSAAAGCCSLLAACCGCSLRRAGPGGGELS
jgi:hypothetical protein